MARPVFLSYAWDGADLSELDKLDQHLRLRGVPVWRDRRKMFFGSYNEGLVRSAIRDQCSGFALYYTDAVLGSDFILEIELAEMDARRQRGAPPPFFAGAVFRRTTEIPAAAEDLRQASGVSLAEPLGVSVGDEDLDNSLRSAANAILEAYLAQEVADEEVCMRVETRGPLPEDDPAVLQLCWSPPLHHDLDEVPPQTWATTLSPALGDLQRALQEAGAPRRLRVGGHMHLSAAVALGWQFRQPTGWTLTLEQTGLECESSLTAPDAHGWGMTAQPGATSGDGRLAVCVHASRDVTNAMKGHARTLPPARATLHVYPPDGAPSRQSVRPGEGNELAAAIAAEIRRCRDTYGTGQTHLYLACPWSLAALLGWHLSSTGRLVVYEPDVERGDYRTACELV